MEGIIQVDDLLLPVNAVQASELLESDFEQRWEDLFGAYPADVVQAQLDLDAQTLWESRRVANIEDKAMADELLIVVNRLRLEAQAL